MVNGIVNDEFIIVIDFEEFFVVGVMFLFVVFLSVILNFNMIFFFVLVILVEGEEFSILGI